MQYSHGAGQYDRSFNVENSGPATGRTARLSPFRGRRSADPVAAEVIDAEFVHVDAAGNVVEKPSPESGGPASPGDFFRRGRARAAAQRRVPSSVLVAPFRRIEALSPIGFGFLVVVLCIVVFWFSGGHALFP